MLNIVKSKLTVIVAVALLMSSCGGTEKAATSTPSSAASPDVSSAPATDAPVASTPLIESGRVSDTVIATLVDDAGTVNEALRKEVVDAILALPEDQQLAVLGDLSLRAELEVASASGLEAAIGSPAATEAALRGAWAQIGTQVAAVDPSAPLEPATRPAGLRRTANPSAGAVGALGIMMGFFGLAATADAIVSAANNLSPDAYEEHPSDGSLITGAVEQSSIEMEFNGKQDGVDVAFKASAVVHPCPTADGSFDIEASIDTKTSKGGAGQNATIDLKINGHVDDDAKIADVDVDNHTQWADFGGGEGQFIDFTFSGATGLENFAFNRSGGTVTKDFVAMSVLIAAAFGSMLATKYIEASEKAWLSGRCVKLEPTASPGPKGLKPSSTSEISAAPRSKIDGGPVGGTVTGALTAGGASVEPVSTKVPADATFNYLAPDEPNKSGTVSLEARSKRGVAKADITLDTAAQNAYIVVGGLEDFQVNMTVCDIMAPFQLVSPGVATMDLSGGLSGTYSATGVFNLSYTGVYTIDLPIGPGQPGTMIGSGGGSIANQAGSGTEKYTLTPTTC
jgi:hypothetical protein